VTMHEMAILNILAREGPLPVYRIAQLLSGSGRAISPKLIDMKAHGLVIHSVEADDRPSRKGRSMPVWRLTEAGMRRWTKP